MSLTRAKRDIDWPVGDISITPPIAIARDWDANVTTLDNPTPTGTNRVALIAIHNEDSGGGASVTNVDVGGQTATSIISVFNQAGGTVGFSNEFDLYFLTEAQLSVLGTNPTITVTFSSTPDVFSVGTVIYNNVDQTSPVVATDEVSDTATSGTLTANAEDEGGSIVAIGAGSPSAVALSNSSYALESDITNSGGEAQIFQFLQTTVGPLTTDYTIPSANRTVAFMVNLRKA